MANRDVREALLNLSVPRRAMRCRVDDLAQPRSRYQLFERYQSNQGGGSSALEKILALLLHPAAVVEGTPTEVALPSSSLGSPSNFLRRIYGECVVFGVPPSTLSRTLRSIEEALDGYEPARISWPSPSRQAELERMFKAREPLLNHTFGFIDGKNFRVQQPSNADLQNAMYNGWLHSVFVTGTICFTADGCISWSKHNWPGSWNNSDTSLEFRMKLTDPRYCPDERMNVVSDSAFPCSAAMTGRILTPLKDGDLERILPSLRSSARTLHNAITSVRRAAEWGIGSVQKVFSRLNLPLPYDPELRGVRLNNLFRMSNYRVRTVGISEIRTTFAGAMELPM